VEHADRFVATLVTAARQWSGAGFADDVTIVVVDAVPSPSAPAGAR